MFARWMLIVTTAVAGWACAGCAGTDWILGDEAYKATSGPYAVQQEDQIWYDAARDRYLPVRIYIPEAPYGRHPVIVFSHGLGAAGDQYTYLGQHWASYGYLAVFPTHMDNHVEAIFNSGPLVRNFVSFGADSSRWQRQIEDISFILDYLPQDERLYWLADMQRVGVAGHSMGAYTANALAGMCIELPDDLRASFRDPRVKAIVAVSPPGPGLLGLNRDSWVDIAVPCLSIIGTHDIDPSTLSPTARRTPFETASGPDQYLLTIRAATHGGFNDQTFLPGDRRSFENYHEFVLMASMAFFDAHLNGDSAGRNWLLAGTLNRLAGSVCTLEFRNVTPTKTQQ
jgi:predicted dienelactone hydrolase